MGFCSMADCRFISFWLFFALLLGAMRWIDRRPPRVERLFAGLDSPHSLPETVQIHSAPANLPELQHAAIAAEHARFYMHHGFDWKEIQIAAKEDLEGERT